MTLSSCSRLRQVQSLLRDGGPAAPEGVLCSLGTDAEEPFSVLYSSIPLLKEEEGSSHSKTANEIILMSFPCVIQGLTADIMRGAVSWPSTCSMGCMGETS